MNKWTLKRFFALALAAMMILTVPEVSAAVVLDAEVEDAVVESTETNDVVEEEATEEEEVVNITETLVGEVENKTASSVVDMSAFTSFKEVDLGSVDTTSYARNFYTTDVTTGIKTDGVRYQSWIERLNLPDYGYEFYDTLVKAADGDGTDDYLVADKYFSNASGTETLIGTYNVIPVVILENATEEEIAEAHLAAGAAYEAFDRDMSIVFWLNGSVMTVQSTITDDYGNTQTLIAFVLKNHANTFDVRYADYQATGAITTGIAQFNAAVKYIRADETVNAYCGKVLKDMTDYEKIEYFNDWLTKNNGYCTAGNIDDYPYTSFECLSALTGQSGVNGPVCEAYARAFMGLCMIEGIPCVLVDGDAGEAHMWNAVQLNGVWYAVDVTWNDPMVTDENGQYITDKVSTYETDVWLLVGSDTVVYDEMFKVSHLEQNTPGITGFAYLNGPELSKTAFNKSIESISVSNQVVTYGDTAMPTVSLVKGSGTFDESKVTYVWYTVDVENETVTVIPTETGAALSANIDAGNYAVEVYYNGEYVGYDVAIVQQRELTATIMGSTVKTYDGTTSCTGEGFTIVLSNKISGDDVSVDTGKITYTYADANAGTKKTVTASGITLIGNDVNNYKLKNTTATTGEGEIEAKDISGATVTLNKDDLTYNGMNQTVTATVTLAGKTLVADTDYTVSGNTAKDVKDSAYTVTVTGKGNYTGTATATYTISYLDADVTVLYNGEELIPAWFGSDVLITAEGYTISDSLDGTYSANYLVSKEGTTSGLKLYFKNEDGYITDAKDIEAINIDKTAPSFAEDGMGIKVSTNIWKEFLNAITFNIFHIQTQEVSITAKDDLSGVLSYWYYVDESGSTTVKTAEDLKNVTFTELEPDETFSISEDGNYVIYAYVGDKAGNQSGYICTDGIVIDKTKPEITNVVQPTVDNGNLKDTSATITFTASEAGTYTYYVGKTSGNSVTPYENNTMVSGNNSFIVNNLDANTEYTVIIVGIDAAGNKSAENTMVFTTQKTLPTIITTPTISGTYGATVGEMDITGGVASVNGTAIAGSWSVTTDTSDVPEVGTSKEYTVKFTPSEENADKYGEVTVKVVPTVEKKAVTVRINDATKTFGTDNPTFTYTADGLVGNEATDVLGLVLTTTATKTSDVDTYPITATANAKNYNVTVVNGTLTITKAAAPTINPITKEYVYGLGSEGNVYVTLGNLLPADNGGAIYSATKVDDKAIIDKLSCGENEVLYSVNNTGSNGDTATITVTATSKNYEDITITINITLVDKLSVSVQGAVTTVGSLTYGDALSKLKFGEVTFVDTEDNVVTGTITWNTPDAKLNAGTHEVAWTFTPSNTGKYKTTTGKVSVTVAKATPEVVTPTVDAITYNPSKTLADVSLPTATNGTWSWKDASIVPTVGNEGYVAVFTPSDAANYNTVEKTVAVEVAKATPVVSIAPTAEAIVYGDTLADSALTGGTADTEGTWSWKDATIAPVVADSETTEYEVVFTPNDTNNYNTTTVKVKLVVEKAQWPVNTPANEIAADYDWDVVGKVELPEGWVWAEEDADTELEFETEVTVTANYVGVDKDNFVNIIKEITITRNVDAPHIEGDEETMGWEAIADEMADTDKDEVRVDMNGHSVVSGDALETLKAEDKTLVVVFKDENGKEEYTWTIKGSDVEDGNVKALDMETELFAKDATDKPAIPEALVKEATANAKDHKFLSLTHDGEFGFKATLTINVGKENAGKLATLYYYNEETGKLLETENIKVEVDADGNISLVFEHASDYVLSINEKPVTPPQGSGAGEGAPAPTPGPTTPDTGDSVFGNVYFYITLLLVGGLAGYVGVRKKREE